MLLASPGCGDRHESLSSSHLHRLTTPSQTKLFSSHGSGLGWRKRRRSQLQLVITAELSRSPSLNIGRDSQTLQSHDIRELRWIGPVPGDIAEVEAYCRIFRAAENLHAALMDTLCDPVTGECMVSYDSSPMEKPLMEDKIASVLGCMLSLMSKGKKDVLSGRSSIMSSFRAMDPINSVEDKLPPLAIFRSETKRCCESLHVALESLLMPGDDRGSAVWRKLQRLKNLCYDLGFPRGDDSPMHWLLANWTPVSLFTSSDPASGESEVAFWKGGQLTDESLQWLLQKGFRTIIDLRAETVKDNFYQAALDDAIMSGKVEICRFPVEIGTAPSMKQVEKFAYLVSDKSKGPIYVHSREGVWRTSAMISRWRQYMTRKELQIVSNGKLAGSFNKVLLADGSFEIEKEDNIIKDGDETKQITSVERDADCEAFSSDKTILLEKSGGNTDEAHSDSFLGKTVVLEEANLGEVRSVLSRDFDPLKSQLPPTNVFCRKEMSRFFKGRKITPSSFFVSKRKVLILPTLREAYGSTEQKRESSEYDSALVTMNAANTNGSSLSNDLSAGPRRYFENGSGLTEKGHLPVNVEAGDVANDSFVGASNNGHAGKSDILGTDTVTGKVENKERIDGKGTSGSSALSADQGSEILEGNMCASTTGVVRVQSRKKAEMFLVRTDGISCTREKVTQSSLAFTHPSTQQQMLMWKSVPKTVLLLKKLGPELMEEAKGVASFLHFEENMNILVEPDVHDIFARMPGLGFVHTFYSQDTSDLHEKVDFVVCLGGDGVILHASNLFRGAVPPVVSFNLGSLGFLTSHTYGEYKQDLRQVIHGNNTREGVYITLRMRLRCEIYRNGKLMPGKVIDVLNEVVVDRGSNPYLSMIECYEHDSLITKVQGDGVIIATPTGSTAYSTSAGGSMVHPNVPCILFTPICPHSLSFRPVILPDSARLELKIPEDARSNAWVSFDGKRRQQLSRGDSIKIYMSEHPLPTVNKSDQTGDWFHSLVRCLNWNERLEQRAL